MNEISQQWKLSQLPLFLNAETAAKMLGVAPSTAYELMHEADFSTLKIGNRIVVPKEQLIYHLGTSAHGRRHSVKHQIMDKTQSNQKLFSCAKRSVPVWSVTRRAGSVFSSAFCEDRNTYQCWPSFKTIGKATRMSTNTVRKYVRMPEDRGLITTEPTRITTKGGQKRNGNLLFTIRPIQEAVAQFYQQQLEEVSLNVQRASICCKS